jgi:hypothetical protein
MVRYAVVMLLLVASCCNLTAEDDIPAEVSSTLRDNVQKAIANLNNFGSGSASLSLIKFYLSNIDKCLDDVFSFRQAERQQQGLPDSNDLLVIANRELEALTDSSTTMDLDFLVSTFPNSPIREIILGVYKINLANLDAISKTPDEVITTLAEGDAFQAAKNIFLNTPQ